MRTTVVALLCMLGGLSSAAAQVPASAEVQITLGEMIGRDAASLRARLQNGSRPEPPIIPGVVIWTEQGVVSLLTVGDLLVDCNAGMPEDPPPRFPNTNAKRVMLVFRDGVLERALRPPPPGPPAARAPAGLSSREIARWYRQRFEERLKQPIQDAFIAGPGALPLEDGAAFLDRRAGDVLPPSTPFTVSCPELLAPEPRQRTPEQHASVSDTLSDIVWRLTMLPAALIHLRPLNEQRAQARRDGPALLGSMQPGQSLGATPEEFARAHSGVRVYHGRDAAYSILTIDLGDERSGNVSRRNDTGFVGVRDGRIIWLSTGPMFLGKPIGSGLSPRLMCLDENNVLGEVRPGCNDYGNFHP